MPKTETKPKEIKQSPIYIVSTDDAEGVVEAVVNVFGIIDLGSDIIHNGAYTKTLNERGNQVKVRVLDSHNTDSVLRVIGKPLDIREIGRDELARIAPQVLQDHPEATGGLYTKTQFLLNTHEGDGAYKRLAAGAVDEWSIALDPLQVEYGRAKNADGKEVPVRHIHQIRLYEYSPVIWGMNQATVTTDVKASEPAVTEQKQGTLDVRLEAYLRMEYAYCVNDWLAEGMVTPDEVDALNAALQEMLVTLRAALPAAIAETTISYYADSAPHDEKQGTLGTKLEACLRREFNWCVAGWLGNGIIDAETADVLDEALKAALVVFRAALPPELAAMPAREYYTALREASTKAGRMISASNMTLIQQAVAALQAVIDAATAEAETNQDEKARREPAGSPLTGPEQETPAPSIIDAAEIDRERKALAILMEMTG